MVLIINRPFHPVLYAVAISTSMSSCSLQSMAYRAVDITFISARELHSVNLLSAMEPYVVARIKEGSQKYDKKKTPVDRENGSNPCWNHLMTYVVEEAALLDSRLEIYVEIRTKGTLRRMKEIGHLSIQLRQFVRFTEDGGGVLVGDAIRRTYDVVKPSGERKGVLNVSVRIGERTDEPRSQEQGNPPTRASVRQGLAVVGTALSAATAITRVADEESDQ